MAQFSMEISRPTGSVPRENQQPWRLKETFRCFQQGYGTGRDRPPTMHRTGPAANPIGTHLSGEVRGDGACGAQELKRRRGVNQPPSDLPEAPVFLV